MIDPHNRERRTVAWAITLAIAVFVSETVVGVVLDPPAWIYLSGLGVLVVIGFVAAGRLLSDKH